MLDTFLLLFERIAPLYLLILAGYLASKFLKCDRQSIGKLLLYGLSPALLFIGALKSEVSISNYSLPIISCIVASFVSLIAFTVARMFFDKANVGLLAYASAASNTGYFGLPVVVVVLGADALDLAVIANLGMIIFECTIGFYLAATANFTLRESLIKLFRLPHLYLLGLGLLLNSAGLKMEWLITAFEQPVKGGYTLLGMMLIGMGLYASRINLSDLKITFMPVVFKFFVSPLLMLLFLAIDRHYFQIYSEQAAKILLIMAMAPVAANTVVIASELKLDPGKAALMVIFTTILALFFIPLYCSWF